MKAFFIFFISLYSLSSFAQIEDTVQSRGRFPNMRFTINVFEVGGLKGFQPNNNTGNEILDQFLNAERKGFQGSAAGVTLYYKHVGLGFIFNTYNVKTNSEEFRAFLDEKFPNYYKVDNVDTYSYYLTRFSFNISYQKHFKQFYIEPKFRFGFDGLHDLPQGFTMKEQGSNQFLRYRFDNEKINNPYSYHFCIDAGHQFKKGSFLMAVQMGLHAEFMIAPVKYKFIVEENSYLYPATSSYYEVKALNPALALSAFFNFTIGK